MKTNVEAYLNAVDRALLCNKVQKKKLIKQLVTDIETFCDDHGEPTTDQLEKYFGTAEEMAEGLLRQTDMLEIKKIFSKKKAILVFVAATCLLLLFGIGFYLLYHHAKVEDYMNGYEKETVVYDEQEVPDFILNPSEDDRIY